MENTTAITAIKAKDRNEAMDVIRGLAVLGILLMNIAGFSSNGFPLVWHDALLGRLTLNGLIYKASIVLFDGKMRGLFTLLFGAGIMLFIENKKQNTIQVADAYFKRMMWLLLFGIIDGYVLLWNGDVLYEYALCGMLLFAFRNMRVRYMVIVSFMCLSILTYVNGRPYNEYRDKSIVYKQTSALLEQGKTLTEEQKQTREEFQNRLDHLLPFSQKVIEENKMELKKDSITYHGSYVDIFEERSKAVFESQSTEFYTGFWEPFGTILLGMALFKLGFFHYRLKLKTYRWWCFLGIPIGIALYVLSYKIQVKTQVDLWRTYEWRPCSVFYIEYPGRVILTIGYASALMLLCRLKWLKGVLSLFANVGRMALTNYIMQTVLCSFYFFGFGLNHYGEYDAKGLLLFVLIIWLIQIIYCWIYFKFFEMGPIEWLWKRLTYGRRLGLKDSEEKTVSA